jgi:hypothetical protein
VIEIDDFSIIHADVIWSPSGSHPVQLLEVGHHQKRHFRGDSRPHLQSQLLQRAGPSSFGTGAAFTPCLGFPNISADVIVAGLLGAIAIVSQTSAVALAPLRR